MSSITNDSQLQNLINLLEKRTQHRDDVDLETKFFNDALEYLLSVNHWWCSSEKLLSIARESLWLFSLPDHDPIVQYKTKLNLQLKSCAYCAKEYQISKISVRKRSFLREQRKEVVDILLLDMKTYFLNTQLISFFTFLINLI